MPPTIYLNALLWLIVGMLIGAAVATFRQKTRTMNRLFMIVGGLSAVLGGMINHETWLSQQSGRIYDLWWSFMIWLRSRW